MSEEKKVEPEKIKLTVTLPTKEAVVKALTNLFPGISVEVEEPKEETPEETTEETE